MRKKYPRKPLGKIFIIFYIFLIMFYELLIFKILYAMLILRKLIFSIFMNLLNKSRILFSSFLVVSFFSLDIYGGKHGQHNNSQKEIFSEDFSMNTDKNSKDFNDALMLFLPKEEKNSGCGGFRFYSPQIRDGNFENQQIVKNRTRKNNFSLFPSLEKTHGEENSSFENSTFSPLGSPLSSMATFTPLNKFLAKESPLNISMAQQQEFHWLGDGSSLGLSSKHSQNIKKKIHEISTLKNNDFHYNYQEKPFALLEKLQTKGHNIKTIPLAKSSYHNAQEQMNSETFINGKPFDIHSLHGYEAKTPLDSGGVHYLIKKSKEEKKPQFIRRGATLQGQRIAQNVREMNFHEMSNLQFINEDIIRETIIEGRHKKSRKVFSVEPKIEEKTKRKIYAVNKKNTNINEYLKSLFQKNQKIHKKLENLHHRIKSLDHQRKIQDQCLVKEKRKKYL